MQEPIDQRIMTVLKRKSVKIAGYNVCLYTELMNAADCVAAFDHETDDRGRLVKNIIPQGIPLVVLTWSGWNFAQIDCRELFFVEPIVYYQNSFRLPNRINPFCAEDRYAFFFEPDSVHKIEKILSDYCIQNEATAESCK